ncbi:fimbrial protein [Proteus mirabilis]|uniref:fimbrial protein n=1 Tax=Proteus mirabilis TaxID=584 RepID=UPI002577B56F|nr:DUF1120 domain-containing protein [Proteus mirabilis]MDM3592570.1 DUF1120 domain-containing protein [Proteus mirabilis]
MKKLLFTIASMILISMPTLAKNMVADLKINGDIKPPTCTINAGDNNIIIDYGVISPSLIPAEKNYALGTKSANITISYDASNYLTLKVSDTYKTSSTDPAKISVFGLVNAKNTEQEIGGYIIDVIDIKVDNKRAYLGRVADKIWTGSSATIFKDTLIALTSEPQAQVDKNNLKLIAGKVFNAKIQIGAYNESRYAYILSRKKLAQNNIDLTDGIDYIGEAVFTFNFGV